jgi:hypothetical protein
MFAATAIQTAGAYADTSWEDKGGSLKELLLYNDDDASVYNDDARVDNNLGAMVYNDDDLGIGGPDMLVATI